MNSLIKATPLENKSVCHFCGGTANYLVGDKFLCSDNFSKCPSIRQKISESVTGTTFTVPTKTCPKCNKDISNSNFDRHVNSCERVNEKRIDIPLDFRCILCGKQLTSKNSYRGHWVHTHTEANKKYRDTIRQLIDSGNFIQWNKGLTKSTNDIVLKFSNTIRQNYKDGKIQPSWSGKHHSEETKKKLSVSRKKYLLDNPTKHPNYLVSNNKSKMTYPEQLVFDYLTNNSYIFQHNVRIDKYWVDFVIDSKTVLEIDGSYWHSSPGQIQYDTDRTLVINQYGYRVLRISAKDVIKNLKIIIESEHILPKAIGSLTDPTK